MIHLRLNAEFPRGETYLKNLCIVFWNRNTALQCKTGAIVIAA